MAAGDVMVGDRPEDAPTGGAATGGAGLGTVLLGAGLGAADLVWRACRPLRAATATMGRRAVDAVAQAAPATADSLARRGRSGWADLDAGTDALLRFAVGRVVAAFLAATDLTALVLRHVDIDAIAAQLDLDAVAARLDLDAVAARLDVEAVVARVDLDAAVARVDLDAAVRRVDLDAAVARVDLDAAVARVDLDAAVRRVDLGAIVARLDPNPVVAAVDLDAAVARIDIVGIAREVIDAIDLPEIIRHSTGALTSDTVRTVRTETAHADDVVAGLVDRMFGRARPGRAVTPSGP